MLHTVNLSPYGHQSLALCLRYARPQCEILLLEDAVTASVCGSLWQKELKQSGLRIYVLKEDLEARGLSDRVADEVEIIDMAGFVALTERHVTQLKW